MRRGSIYLPVDRTRFCSSNTRRDSQLGPATLTAGILLAILCLLFGTAFAAYVPASLEQRIGSLILFGLVPAAGFYLAGHILGHLMVLGSELCAMTTARCCRCFVFLVESFMIWVRSPVSYVSIRSLSKLSVVGQKTYHSIRDRCRRAYVTFIEFLCLLVRSGAKFGIRMQASCARCVSHGFRGSWDLRSLIVKSMLLVAFGLGWVGGNSILLPDPRQVNPVGGALIDVVVERIIGIESNGDPNAKNKRSSATGLGQFLDETWLDLIWTHRPDLARGRSVDKTLELRRDAKLAREITTRFTEQNARILRKRGLPVTPGTLYLAHFAGGAGAVAILSALDDADAASVMAGADATGRTKREKIIKANPFLERFTVADLRNWADRKMRVPGS